MTVSPVAGLMSGMDLVPHQPRSNVMVRVGHSLPLRLPTLFSMGNDYNQDPSIETQWSCFRCRLDRLYIPVARRPCDIVTSGDRSCSSGITSEIFFLPVNFFEFMRAVVQRVSQAAVTVEGSVTGKIQQGLLVLLGVESGDSEHDLEYVLRKTLNLRIFDDPEGKMNLSLSQVGGKILVVSQFTLFGDVRRGNRPSFIQAAPPTLAWAMYQEYVDRARQAGFVVETGVFQAAMQVTLVNQGPVTLVIDSRWA